MDNSVQLKANVNNLMVLCFGLAYEAGWHTDIKTGEYIKHDPGNRMMLINSEITEAFEGFRKDINDDHLTHRKMAEVELADAMIRILDTAGYYGFDLGGALVEKLIYNTERKDHKKEARLAVGGKQF